MNDKALIGTMFEIIDGRRWTELGEVFDAHCVYERPGFAQIVGLAALREFYETHRPIECGTHRIDLLVAEDEKVCASGRFVGFLRDGSELSLRFSDLYRLREARVVWRSTFFFTPLA